LLYVTILTNLSIMRAASLLLAAVLTASTAAAQPAIDAILNGASFNATLAPGCWATIFGKNLAAGSVTAQTVPLPTSLGNVSVTIGGVAAPLLYVSPTQINVLIPATVTIPANTVVPVVVSSSSTASATYNIRLTRNAPAIFTRNGNGTGRALVFDAAFSAVDTLKSQDTVILYATGLGPTDASGKLTDLVTVMIGERAAQVSFAGLAPGFPGIYQLNVVVPVPATDRLYLSSGGWISNITDIGIAPGANTTNLTGSIKGLYPSTDPYFTLPRCVSDDPAAPPCSNGQSFSVMLNAATYTVGFDIVPSAAPFDVAAVGPGFATVFTLDPATHTFRGNIATVSRAAALGDFAATGWTLWDYASCTAPNAVCLGFPGNLIPPSRLDPKWLQSTATMPAPNGPVSVFGPVPANGTSAFLGAWNGSRFALDASVSQVVTTLGSFVQVPYGPFDKATSTFKLYVDGKLVASQDVPYTVTSR
jgi:uncharacterized protein (TIGR03437 family)